MDCGPSGSSVHGILWARILEWVAISFSRGSSWPRDRTQGSNPGLLCWRQILYICATGTEVCTRSGICLDGRWGGLYLCHISTGNPFSIRGKWASLDSWRYQSFAHSSLFVNDTMTTEKEDKILVHCEHGTSVVKVTVVTVWWGRNWELTLGKVYWAWFILSSQETSRIWTHSVWIYPFIFLHCPLTLKT